MSAARVVAGIFLVASAAWGPAAVEAAGMSETEFLALLDDEHPAVVVLGDELADRLGERRAPRTENPGVSFEREAPEGGAAQSTVKLSWRPPLDARRGLANQAAEAGLGAAEHRLDWNRLQLRTELRELFADWALAVERRDLFSDLTERTLQLAERARARASTGEETGLSARRLALAAAEARTALAETRVELYRIEARIHAMFPDLETDGLRPIRPSLPAAPATTPESVRPDVQAQAKEVERAELARRLAGRYLEFPTIFGGWTTLDEDGGIDGPVLGLEWNLPLFDRRQGDRERTTRELHVARAELALARSRAEAERNASRGLYEELRVAATEVLETTEGTGAVIEAATAAFQAGEAGLTDLLETLRSATDGRLAALRLHAEALAAHRRLELSTGRPLSGGS